MGAEQKTHFQIDKSKCIKCGKCINTCSCMVIAIGTFLPVILRIVRLSSGRPDASAPAVFSGSARQSRT